EAREHRCLLADLREDLCLGIAGDVVCDGEGAVSTRPLGMHATLRDDLAGEMRKLFDQPHVLQQYNRPARPSGLNIDVIRDRRARCVRQKRSSSVAAHRFLLLLVTSRSKVERAESSSGASTKGAPLFHRPTILAATSSSIGRPSSRSIKQFADGSAQTLHLRYVSDRDIRVANKE